MGVVDDSLNDISFWYGITWVLALVATTLYSYYTLKHRVLLEKDLSIGRRCIYVIESVWHKKSMYFPLFIHVFDQATDFNFLLEVWKLAKQERRSIRDDDYDPFPGVNMTQIFAISSFVMLFYRIMSSILLYLQSKSKLKAVLQFLDLEIFEAVYINWRVGSNKPSDPQKWVQRLEATFESAPQALVQLYYLIRMGKWQSKWILTSVAFSFFSICDRLIEDDASIFSADARKLFPDEKSDAINAGDTVGTMGTFPSPPNPPTDDDLSAKGAFDRKSKSERIMRKNQSDIANVKSISAPNVLADIGGADRAVDTAVILTIETPKAGDDDEKESAAAGNGVTDFLDMPSPIGAKEANEAGTDDAELIEEIRTREKAGQSLRAVINELWEGLSWKYLLRIVFRVVDVTSKIILYSLFWVIVGGMATAICLLTEVFLITVISIKEQKPDYFNALIGVSFAFANTPRPIKRKIQKLREKIRTLQESGCFNTVEEKQLRKRIHQLPIRHRQLSIRSAKMLMMYRFITSFIFLAVIALFGLHVRMGCTHKGFETCPLWDDRRVFKNHGTVMIFYIYCWLCALIEPKFISFLFDNNLINSDASSDRSVVAAIQNHDLIRAVELMIFGLPFDSEEIRYIDWMAFENTVPFVEAIAERGTYDMHELFADVFEITLPNLAAFLSLFTRLHVNNVDYLVSVLNSCQSPNSAAAVSQLYDILVYIKDCDALGVRLDGDNTCLHFVCLHSQIKHKPKYLTLFKDFYPDAFTATNNKGMTPLHIAVDKNNPDMVVLLLNTQSIETINTEDRDGNTPMHLAALLDSSRSLGVLLACDTIDMSLRNGWGWTVWHIVADASGLRRQRTRSGSTTDEVDILGASNLTLLIDYNLEGCNELNDEDETPFFLACKSGNSFYVETMLAMGASDEYESKIDYSHTDENGVTPLMTACRNGKADVVSKLCETPFGRNALTIVDKSKHTCLMESVRRGTLSTVSLLLAFEEVTPLINAQNRAGDTALHIALRMAGDGRNMRVSIRCIELLFETGADKVINATNNMQQTPLLLGLGCDAGVLRYEIYTDILKLLLTKGADPLVVTHEGDNVLHLLAQRETNMRVVHFMFKEVSQLCDLVNAFDDDGYTPLYYALSNEHTPFLEFLVSKGADLNRLTLSEYPEGPFRVAMENPEVLHWLLRGDMVAVDMNEPWRWKYSGNRTKYNKSYHEGYPLFVGLTAFGKYFQTSRDVLWWIQQGAILRFDDLLPENFHVFATNGRASDNIRFSLLIESNQEVKDHFNKMLHKRKVQRIVLDNWYGFGRSFARDLCEIVACFVGFFGNYEEPPREDWGYVDTITLMHFAMDS